MNTFNLSFEELKNYVFCLKYFVRSLRDVLHMTYSLQTTESITLWPHHEWHLHRLNWWSQGKSTLLRGNEFLLFAIFNLPFFHSWTCSRKNSSPFPYLGLQPDSPVYILENTHLPSANFKKKTIKPNTTTTKNYFCLCLHPRNMMMCQFTSSVKILTTNSQRQMRLSLMYKSLKTAWRSFC